MDSYKMSATVTVVCMILSTVAALPSPQVLPSTQQSFIQENFLVPTQTRTAESQVTGVLRPAIQPTANSLFSSIIIDILPQISNFTKRLESRNGVQTTPQDFVSAVTKLTSSFVQARARDERREVTQKEVDSIFLTEAAFNITLELVKDLAQGNNIAFAIKRFTAITPRLAEIGAAVEGRELTKDEIDDLREANELVGVLTPFFEQLSKLNLNAGHIRAGTGNLSNYNVDVIQDYANQNLLNLRDFTKSNFQNFKDYSRLQFPEFSSDRAQEYFENNVHRVQDLTRLGLKNAETLPERIAPNGANFGKISSQVADIINFSDANIKGTQQINLNPLLDDQEFSRRTLDVTSFSKSLTDRIQQLSRQRSQIPKTNTQTFTRFPLVNGQPHTLPKPSGVALHTSPSTLQSTSSQSTLNRKSVTPLAKSNSKTIQTLRTQTQAPTGTSSGTKQNLSNQNLAAQPQTIQNIRTQTQAATSTSLAGKQTIVNQNLVAKAQTIGNVRPQNQAATTASLTGKQTIFNQDIAAQLANGNARIIGLVRTDGGLLPLIQMGQHSTLG